jgi:transposase
VQHAAVTPSPTLPEKPELSASELRALLAAQAATIGALTQQLEWFKRQLFGAKSERFAPEPDPAQLHLGETFAAPPSTPEPRKEVGAHTRRAKRHPVNESAESLPFFDESRVPVETIRLPNPKIAGLEPDQYEVIDEKVSFRLAQRPGSYVVLKYLREVVKLRESETLHCPPAPTGVLEGSRADVSLLAGLIVDKFAWHLPLNRQHQRMEAAYIKVSRPWLTQLTQKSLSLLEPIYEAQLQSIRASRVKAMDETPIKAGRTGHGKLRSAYFWPVYGELDEVCFPYFASRAAVHVREALGLRFAPHAVLLTDGYAAYRSFAEKLGLTHAQCWVHARRGYFEAKQAEPERCAEALEQIQALYAIEDDIREHHLSGESKQLHRLTHSKPQVDAFFAWVDRQLRAQDLLPMSPFTQALGYVRERRAGLEVFLTDAEVPLDTNHLERALRAIPMGRKNWNFCWTELGAHQVGIAQSLIVTCRLHGIDPFTYLVDVLQRVGAHPAARVEELTPRRWKALFAANPLRSDLRLA